MALAALEFLSLFLTVMSLLKSSFWFSEVFSVPSKTLPHVASEFCNAWEWKLLFFSFSPESLSFESLILSLQPHKMSKVLLFYLEGFLCPTLLPISAISCLVPGNIKCPEGRRNCRMLAHLTSLYYFPLSVILFFPLQVASLAHQYFS